MLSGRKVSRQPILAAAIALGVSKEALADLADIFASSPPVTYAEAGTSLTFLRLHHIHLLHHAPDDRALLSRLQSPLTPHMGRLCILTKKSSAPPAESHHLLCLRIGCNWAAAQRYRLGLLTFQRCNSFGNSRPAAAIALPPKLPHKSRSLLQPALGLPSNCRCTHPA
ncbi:hypothetical protein HPB50_002115 [Hyalomma asiaticum]|uniref:Uncharacterized protein n=1 Tax=Hyalomma asiaticum TaxID=266040 RepID=A0ACB7TDA9_HYAAI|nr:hypothetical protein HPB50_002115 [Hyalomma asiaticum]